jgi:hypothetical protein
MWHDIVYNILNPQPLGASYAPQNENWMEFEFNNWTQIQSKTNGMQIAEKRIQNLLMNMMLEKKKKNFLKTWIWKNTFFSWVFTLEWAK